MKSGMLKSFAVVFAGALLALRALAEEGPPELNLNHLETQAVERVTITLDKQMLDFAARFLPKDDPEAQTVRKLVKDLDAICVRSLKFSRDAAYSASDVEKVRQQLVGPGWSKLVEARGKENVDFYLKLDGDKVQGVTVISAEPRDLTVVTIRGALRPEQLSELEGFAGIPHGLCKPHQKPLSAEKPQHKR
jgi:hypothetical protein